MKITYILTNIVFMIVMGILLTYFNNTILSYSQSNDDSLTFEDPLSGVQFQYTDEWVKEGSSLFGSESECSSLPCMKLPEISVSIYPIVTEDFLLENHLKDQISYHNISQGYIPIALNETKIGEKKALQYVYTSKPPLLTDEISNQLMNYEIYTTEGINLYKITFTDIEDENLDKYLNSFKKIVDTFTITK
jgi:hypothetical protein